MNDEPEQVQRLERELGAARTASEEHEQKYLRVLAEMDNFKKRLERSHTELARQSKKKLFANTLGVLDNLDRAIRFEASAKEDPANLVKGLRMTYWQLNELLGAEGVKPIEALGQPFDPRLHEAVDIDLSGTAAPGIITAEIERGYYYLDEVLRAAKVRVAASASQRQAS